MGSGDRNVVRALGSIVIWQDNLLGPSQGRNLCRRRFHQDAGGGVFGKKAVRHFQESRQRIDAGIDGQFTPEERGQIVGQVRNEARLFKQGCERGHGEGPVQGPGQVGQTPTGMPHHSRLDHGSALRGGSAQHPGGSQRRGQHLYIA